MSGPNKGELYKVLDFFRHDTLKFKAACFLIKNLDGKYCYFSNNIQDFYNKVSFFIGNTPNLNNKIVQNHYDNLLKNSKNETINIYYGYINNNDDINNVLNNYTRYAESVVKGIANYYGKNYSYNFDNEYVVKKGDTLYSIAKKYNTTVNEIKSINNLKTNTLSIGQILKIPELIDDDYYIVKKGDTLYSISKKYNITVNELKSLNNLTSNTLSINQKLIIPKINTYTVKKGDTLYSIAKNNNTTVDNIKLKNNLKSNLINVGDILLI